MDFILYLIGIILFFYTAFAIDTEIPMYVMFYPIIFNILLIQLNIIKNGKEKNTKSKKTRTTKG